MTSDIKPLQNIAVTYSDPKRAGEAEVLAKKLKLALGSASSSHQLRLCLDHIELVDTTSNSKPFFIDFNSGALNYRRLHGGGRSQAISRAIGLKQNKCPFVVDATAGLGRDSFILAALGCTMTLFERNPILQVLLADGLRRGLENPETAEICKRMELISKDIQEWQWTEQQADVIYLDPMYPHRKKSSLVKKDMRIIRQLVGDDEDADNLLTFALHTGIKKIVVKRPKNAPFLGNKTPTTSLKEKNSRFDIYLN